MENLGFVFVGDGPEKPRLIAMANEMNLANVEFRKSVPKDEVSGVLCEADATILILKNLPLYRYGISLNKLFDYMAAARPVILAGNPINNPVKEANCGFTVPPRAPHALAEAIVKLNQMPNEERVAMGRRGRECVEKHHAIPALAKRLMDCLGDL